MSSQAFEILCPVCRSVVPPDAPGCPTCAERKRAAASASASVEHSAPVGRAAAPQPSTASGPAPDLAGLSLKDYHRVVRATYHANEGMPRGTSRARAYLPFALLVILLIIGAAVIFGHL